MFTLVTVLTVILSPIAIAELQERHTHPAGAKPTGLGVVAFANSGAPAAQEPFLRGLALLHSFEYDEAAEDFRKAQQADPKFAMAFWGEAVTYSHLLWGEDDVTAARGVLNRLASTREARLAKAGTARERAYGAAVEALFADSDLPTRVRGFAESMRHVTATYPNDLDAAAFTSLALMFSEYVGQLPSDPRSAVRSEAITFAERVFRTDPRHPGGTHYLIHATDDPALASRGLDAARLYAKIAPDAEHALHMPSHIFVALGLWDDAVASNERAWAASRAEIAARKLSNADLSFHALQWLQYGYLQQGRYRAARDLIDTARAVLAGVDLNAALHVDARYAVGWLEFVHAANTGDWSGSVCQPMKDLRGVQPASSDRERSFHSRAVYHAAIATVMCGRGNGALDAIRARVEALSATDSPERMLGIALLHGRLARYIQTGSAGDLVGLLADGSEPARAPVGLPATLRTEELLGEARLKAGRPHEAVAAYERALQLTPNRSLALLGLARARTAAGNSKGAADAYRQLLANWHSADKDLPTLAEVRRGAQPK